MPWVLSTELLDDAVKIHFGNLGPAGPSAQMKESFVKRIVTPSEIATEITTWLAVPKDELDTAVSCTDWREISHGPSCRVLPVKATGTQVCKLPPQPPS